MLCNQFPYLLLQLFEFTNKFRLITQLFELRKQDTEFQGILIKQTQNVVTRSLLDRET